MAGSITLIGAGRMGMAMASGWLEDKNRPSVEIVDPSVGDLVAGWADAGTITLNPAPAPADVLVIAVKPQIFQNASSDIAARVGPATLVVSVMAGIDLAGLEAALGSRNLVRVMPNTPGAIGRGVALLSAADSVAPAALDRVKALLAPLGRVEGPMSETDLVKATAVSGCGPAYVFLLAELMANAGAARGLDPELSARIARATVEGAAALMAGSDQTPEALRQAVTSPGGVTKAALDVLMAPDAVPSLFETAFAAAEQRDKELSGS